MAYSASSARSTGTKGRTDSNLDVYSGAEQLALVAALKAFFVALPVYKCGPNTLARASRGAYMVLGTGETRRALPEDASAYGERTKLPALGLGSFSSPSSMKEDEAVELLSAFLVHFPKRDMMTFSGATSGMGITAWDFAEAAQGPLNLLAYLNGRVASQPRTNDVAVTVGRPVPDEKATGFVTPARPTPAPASPAQAPTKATGGRAAATPMQAVPFGFETGDDFGYDFGAESDFGEEPGRHVHVESKPAASRGGIVAGLSSAVSSLFGKAAPVVAAVAASTPLPPPTHAREVMYLYSKTAAAKPDGAVRHCEGSTCRGASVPVTASQALADRSVPCKVCCKSESGDVHAPAADDSGALFSAASFSPPLAVASPATPSTLRAPAGTTSPLLYAVVTDVKYVMAPFDYLQFVIQAGGAQLTLHAATCASARNAMSAGRCISASYDQWNAAFQRASAGTDLKLKVHAQCASRVA